jgi:hypothetical protein
MRRSVELSLVKAITIHWRYCRRQGWPCRRFFQEMQKLLLQIRKTLSKALKVFPRVRIVCKLPFDLCHNDFDSLKRQSVALLFPSGLKRGGSHDRSPELAHGPWTEGVDKAAASWWAHPLQCIGNAVSIPIDSSDNHVRLAISSRINSDHRPRRYEIGANI